MYSWVATVTFSHFSDVSWVGGPFMMSLTTMRGLENTMAAVFVSLLFISSRYRM